MKESDKDPFEGLYRDIPVKELREDLERLYKDDDNTTRLLFHEDLTPDISFEMRREKYHDRSETVNGYFTVFFNAGNVMLYFDEDELKRIASLIEENLEDK